MRTGEAKFCVDVPEGFAPPPTKGLMAIVLVTDVAEKLSSFDVSENAQHPEQFAVDAAGRRDSREEGTVMVSCKVTVTVFGDLFPSPKIERKVKILMAEDPVAILGGSVALKFMDDGD